MTSHHIPPAKYQDSHLQFTTHGLNCFAVVRYLASSIFSPINPDLFYTYLYLYSHYDFLQIAASPNYLYRQPFDAEVLTRYVLAEKLGLELIEVPIQGNLKQCILQHLDQMWPVIIPVDKGVFLSGQHNSFYDELEDPYPLLVIGYDSDTQQYLIYDNVIHHLDQSEAKKENNDFYVEFSIDERVIEQAYTSSSMHYQFMRGCIHIIRPKGSAPIKSRNDAIADIVNQVHAYTGHFSDLLTRKLTNFSQRPLASSERERDYMVRSELRYINSQRILCDTLPKLCENYLDTEKVVRISLQAWQAWKNLFMVFNLISINKQPNFKSLEKLQYKVFEAEEAFLQYIANSNNA